MIRDDSTYRLIRDHLGSVRIVVNVASGTVAQRLSYDEFGIETENTNADWQPFGYAGGLTDSQTGLIRFGARDYDPQAGRWSAKDPIGFAAGGLGLYEYVGSDPINQFDPLGLYSWSEFGSDLSNGIVGFGDGVSSFLTFGILSTSDVRSWMGIEGGYDPCAGAYSLGNYTPVLKASEVP
jgi:RHS repeat-associated protein